MMNHASKILYGEKLWMCLKIFYVTFLHVYSMNNLKLEHAQSKFCALITILKVHGICTELCKCTIMLNSKFQNQTYL